MKFLVWLLVPVALGGQEKSGAELTEELIIAASPFVQDDRGWRPSSITRQLLLSSGGQAWKRRSGNEGGGKEEEQQGRSGRSLYIPYSPGPDALRWAGNIHRNTQGFLFIHRVNLWFVFVVCSAPILNNKLVRHPDDATSHLFKVTLPSKIRTWKLFCKIETCDIIFAPVFIIHQYAMVGDLVEGL